MERKDKGDRGRKELSALCLGTGHLHRETLRKLFVRQHRFSLGLDDFLRRYKREYVVFKWMTSSERSTYSLFQFNVRKIMKIAIADLR